jgi:hypothetical protein
VIFTYGAHAYASATKYAEAQRVEKERLEQLQASVDDWPRSPLAPVSERAALAFRSLGIWLEEP